MSTGVLDLEAAPQSPQIECCNCLGRLPLRLSKQGERAAVWLCAECSVPFVSLCLKDHLSENAVTVRLDERYFDITDLPEISNKIRREVARLAEKDSAGVAHNQRRSERINQSLVIPAVKLDAGLNPVGRPFQLMSANISREGIGLVHNEPIEAEYIAIKLTLEDQEPIQVVVRLVRERELAKKPLREFGGEFFVRLGSVAEED